MNPKAAALGFIAVLAAACETPQPATGSPASEASKAAPAAAAGQVGRQLALVNPGFESEPVAGRNCPPQWNCTMHSDPGSFRMSVDPQVAASGQRSGRIERVRNEPWALLTQVVRDPAVRGARVRFSISVRVKDVPEGGGPFVLAHGSGGRPLTSNKSLVSGNHDWQRVAIEFQVPREAELIEIGATMEGPGTMWVDDAQLEILAAPG